MDIPRTTMKKLLLLIAFAALSFSFFQWIDGAVIALRFLGSLFSPFLIGGALAFVLNVPMRFIEKKLFPARASRKKGGQVFSRLASLLLTLLCLVVTVLLLVLVIAPELGRTVSGLSGTIQTAVVQFILWSEKLFAGSPQVVEWLENLRINWKSLDWDGILSYIFGFLKAGAGGMLSSTITAAKSLVNGVITGIIAVVFSCYILLQKEKLGLQCRKALYALLPQKAADSLRSVCSLSQRIFSNFITGQCLEAVILGSMFFVAMTILNLPYALLVGCLISVTALIPIVGAFIGLAVGAFLILLVSPVQTLVFIIMFLVLQQIEENLIYPYVVGNSVGLPSIWVLAAVTIGGNLMGVFGMLIFIPLVSVFYTLFREYVYKRLKEKDLHIK